MANDDHLIIDTIVEQVFAGDRSLNVRFFLMLFEQPKSSSSLVSPSSSSSFTQPSLSSSVPVSSSLSLSNMIPPSLSSTTNDGPWYPRSLILSEERIYLCEESFPAPQHASAAMPLQNVCGNHIITPPSTEFESVENQHGVYLSSVSLTLTQSSKPFLTASSSASSASMTSKFRVIASEPIDELSQLVCSLFFFWCDILSCLLLNFVVKIFVFIFFLSGRAQSQFELGRLGGDAAFRASPRVPARADQTSLLVAARRRRRSQQTQNRTAAPQPRLGGGCATI